MKTSAPWVIVSVEGPMLYVCPPMTAAFDPTMTVTPSSNTYVIGVFAELSSFMICVMGIGVTVAGKPGKVAGPQI